MSDEFVDARVLDEYDAAYLETDSIPCSLKEPLDLAKLRDPNSGGCTFELDVDGRDLTEGEVETFSNACFDREEVFHQTSDQWAGDDEDDDEDDNSDESPFERKAKKMTDISPYKDMGVTKKIREMGAGNVAPPNSLVIIHYNAFTEYADWPFDLKYLYKRVKRFRLGKGQVIAGLDIAVASMKKNERASFIFKPEYAFGEMGAPPRIPKQAWLQFEVHLVDFVEKGNIQDYLLMTEEEQFQIPFNDVLRMVKGEKEEGTKLYNIRNYKAALQKYHQAMTILEKHPTTTTEEPEIRRTYLLKLYLNLALCSLQLKFSKRALYYCTKVLEMDSCNVKALYRRGQALHQLRQFDQAKEALLKACRVCPTDRNIRRELEAVNKSIRAARELDSKLYQRMLQLDKLNFDDEDKKSAAAAPTTSNKGEDEVSERFKASLREWLQRFMEDNSRLEMEPPAGLSPPEIQALLEMTEELGLSFSLVGPAQTRHILIRKKTAEGKNKQAATARDEDA